MFDSKPDTGQDQSARDDLRATIPTALVDETLEETTPSNVPSTADGHDPLVPSTDGDGGSTETVAADEHATPVPTEEISDEDAEPSLSATLAANGNDASTLISAPDPSKDVDEIEEKDVPGPANESLVVENSDDPSDAEEKDVEPPYRPSSWPPSRERVLTWVAFGSVVLLAAILRFWGLGDKPLHHDESLHAYFSIQFVNTIGNWGACFSNLTNYSCYRYDPLLHGPFQFTGIGLVYTISKWLGAPDNGVNTTTVRIMAATLGTLIVALPYFLRDRMGALGAWLACFLLAVSPGLVYFSRFAREDIYMACFTFLLVVGVARYLSTRKARWLMIAALAFALSYATKEATFLTIGVFGSFLGAAIVWELGKRINLPVRARFANAWYAPKNAAPILVILYFVILAPIAKIFFALINALSAYITDPKYSKLADAYLAGLKDRTVQAIPWIGILLGIWVLVILAREIYGKEPNEGRSGLAARVDPTQQPLLNTIVTTPWTFWFFAMLLAWGVFLLLFTVFFTNIRDGIGSGVWQGLYYWVQQIPVGRGGQPWYYYLMLIPMYEQIGLIFGIFGVVRALRHPTPFRLFLVYWFVGNAFIYSWASEKMPWLMIHITIPMILLAAIGLEPSVQTIINAAKGWLARRATQPAGSPSLGEPVEPIFASTQRPSAAMLARSAFVGVMAVLLLIPTLHNMYEVTYVNPANAPHEMMVYVQTSPDINTVMAKIEELDQKYYGGNHQIPIGLADGADWPYFWYLRDYTNVCFSFPRGCPGDAAAHKEAVIIAADDDNRANVESQYGKNYNFHTYVLRWWWDEGYKPLCNPNDADYQQRLQSLQCGEGLGTWLSYGSAGPPSGAPNFSLGLAIKNIWQWEWDRKPIGAAGGDYYAMDLMIRNDLAVQP
ncbi:MAG TPA: flippase activity-associated protein Agl23 [Ktedonosporobacter sp.]|nr:flippase activity-associated protein Agl23 [Ktedonosporobacter sp.]